MVQYLYPPTKSTDQTELWYGNSIPDPYRWLEEVDSPETQAWIEAQNALTFAYLEKIPARLAIRARMIDLWDFARAQAPRQRGGRYFQLRNSGLQNQDVLFVMGSLEDEPRCLLDPNTLSSDGTIALTSWSVSPDGRWLAYAISASGSDWLEWRIRNVVTGEDLADRLMWSKFSDAEWLADSSGFYYSRYSAPDTGEEYQGVNYYQKLYFHQLGASQEDDILVYERPDQKEWGFAAHVSDDGCYLVVTIWQGTDVRNRLFYQDLQVGSQVVELISELEATYSFVGNDGPIFYLYTNKDASRGRLIAVDIANHGQDNWHTVIEEGEDVLEGVVMSNDLFVAVYLHHAHHQIRLFERHGTSAGTIELPALGSLLRYDDLGISCRREDSELFFTFQAFNLPPTVYQYNFTGSKPQAIFTPRINSSMASFETHQLFIPGKDGVQVPMFIVHRKNLERNGQNPTLLYGYGGFNIPVLPNFSVPWLVWLELGGVLAVANLRGGGEYGEAWHQAGMLHNKQNVFNDFIACAEYLVETDITSQNKLAILGRSNGGLLVGACLTQRPDLFGAALPAVGVMDMLRFHKFTIGWAWTSEYGSPDDTELFQILLRYSPLHNIRAGGQYPATLVTTADHDDRVVPGHSFKFIAALQAAQAASQPVLIRIQTQAGHGYGKPTAVLIEEYADQWAFLVQELGVPGSPGWQEWGKTV